MEVIEKSVATIADSDDEKFGPNGGFTAILTNESVDRDNESLDLPGWLPFADRYPLDFDHEMSVAGTIGSYHPYIEGDNVLMDAYFSSIPKAQEVRTLVNEGHIRAVSVAFMTDRSKKDGPRREMLNAGIVAIPSNRDAVIMASKAASVIKESVEQGLMTTDEVKVALGLSEGRESASETKDPKRPYGDVHYADPGYQSDGVHRYPIDTPEHVRAAWSYIHQSKDRSQYSAEQLSHIEGAIRAAAAHFGIELSKSVDDAEVKAPQSAGSGDRAMLQAIHDASVHMGATCVIPLQGDDDPTGADDGANKCAETDQIDTEAHTKQVEDDAVEILEVIEVPDDSPLGETLAAFEKQLDEVLTSEESPAESPAEAAAATDEVPAPAVDAADDAADAVAEQEERARILRMQLLGSSI